MAYNRTGEFVARAVHTNCQPGLSGQRRVGCRCRILQLRTRTRFACPRLGPRLVPEHILTRSRFRVRLRTLRPVRLRFSLGRLDGIPRTISPDLTSLLQTCAVY